jgi:outer membrane protein assembly factor BamB
MSDITSARPPVTPSAAETAVTATPPPPQDLSEAVMAQAPAVKVAAGSAERRPRIWPAVIIIVLQWLGSALPRWIAPATLVQFYGMFLAPQIGALVLMAWWLFASRIRLSDRLLGIATFVASGTAAMFLCDKSVPPMALFLYALPLATTAWVLWLLLTPFLSWPVRRIGLLTLFVLVWGIFPLLRSEGIDGSFSMDFRPRWTRSSEELSNEEIAGRRAKQQAVAILPGEKLALQPGDWPGFRGANRDGRLTGERIATDWKQRPPRQLWRQRVGPGWSSFAVVGDRLYTQEQRDKDKEVVVCYHADTGSELWVHADATRFEEIVGGPGPRATPTFHEGKLFAQGANGRLNCLDAVTGHLIWSRDIVADSGAKIPQWGFAASPLIANGIVTVFTGAKDKSVVAYRAASGEPVWSRGEGNLSYCSPQPAKIGGVEQVLLATNAGLTSFHPVKGDVLWSHTWEAGELARIVQPALLDGDDVLIGTGMDVGTRRIHVDRADGKWTVKEMYTTRAIKPYFNDLVVHRGHLYGFDGSFFTCVSVADGARKWRARGYGNGQVLLLADQDVLLVLSETGEAVLLEANPEAHKELSRFQALHGKTWNHPVVARGRLYVRNGEEAACYQLTNDSISP